VRLAQLVYLTAEPTHKTSHNKLHICLVQATLLDHINLDTPLNTVYILNRTFHVIIFVKRIGHLFSHPDVWSPFRQKVTPTAEAQQNYVITR